jgi:hypothetical protein
MVSNFVMNFSILRSVKALVLVTVTTVGISYFGYAQANKKPTVALSVIPKDEMDLVLANIGLPMNLNPGLE